ncbi:MAG: DUF2341 domain-containing protein [Acidobacteriota bacterium]|jgi:hypothetical protein
MNARPACWRGLAALVVGGLALSAAGEAEAAFAFRKPLVVRGGRVSGGPHADFPVLVSVTDPQLATTANGGGVASDRAYDIEFRANDLVTILEHEVETYDPVAGTLIAWVRLPSITTAVDVTIQLYFGDASVTCARSNPKRIWDPDFRYVYHLAETAGDPADSTANAVPATRNPTGAAGMVETPGVAGWIGRALDLVSAPVVAPIDQYLPTTPTHVRVDDGALPADPAFTMEAWFQADTLTVGAYYGFFSKGRDSGVDWIGEYMFPQGSNHRFGLGWPLPAGNVDNIPTLNAGVGQWYHGVVSSTGGANPTRTAYLDGGAIASSAVAAALGSIVLPTRLGDDSNGTYLDGQLDEVRFSNVARSANWIATTYQNHHCPSLSVNPAGCPAGDHFVDDSALPVAAGLPSFSNATATTGLDLAGVKDGGLTWGDFNNDSCLDVLVNSDDATVYSHLYLQQKSDTCTNVFDDVTSCLAGDLLTAVNSRTAIWGDLDNDGNLDFAVNNVSRIWIFLSNGAGVTAGAGCPAAGVPWTQFGTAGAPSQVIDLVMLPPLVNVEGLGFLDYDADGDLDLIAASQETQRVDLLENDGTGTMSLAFGTGLPSSGMGDTDYIAVADYDVDGDVDYVVRSDVAVDLYRNNGGTFSAGTFDEAAINTNKGGVAFCDFDNDGDFDIAWTDAPDPARLFEQVDPTTFVVRTSLAPGGFDMDGVACGDIDNDGDVDLVVTETGRDYVARNDGGWTFTDVTPAPVASFGVGDGEGVALGDTDRDGDLDILINQSGTNEFWRNELGSNNYLMVRALTDPDGAGPGVARDALGATVTLKDCDGNIVAGVRDVSGGRGHGSQDPALVHIGLPTSGVPRGPAGVYVVEVQYPGGLVREQAVIPLSLGCYQQVTVADTAASDTSLCIANSVELMSFEACGVDRAVELTWETGSELHNLGFHLYRSPSSSGPWEQVTSTLIPGLGSSPLGERYRYLDPGLQNGERYFYELEDVETRGPLTRHGPVWAEPSAEASPGCSGDTADTTPGEGAVLEEGVEASPEAEAARTSPRTYGRPEDASFRVVSRTKRARVVELRTPGFVATETPSGMKISVPGFDQSTDPRSADLPLKRVLLDALVGRHARIVWVKERRVRSYPGHTPAAVGAAEIITAPDGTVRPGRRAAALRGEGLLPPFAASIAGDAFIGETKKLALEMSPLRYDASTDTLLLAQTLRVKIAFDRKAAREETGRGSHGRRRPRSVEDGASEVLVRLHTRTRGLHAVSFETLFPLGHEAVHLDSLRLSLQGQAVPFHVEPKGKTFGPGSVLFFWASTEAASTDYSGEMAYALEQAPGGIQMPQISTRLRRFEPLASAPLAQSSGEANRYYQAGLLDAPDIWLWDFMLGGMSKSFPLTLEGVDPASALPAHLQVFLQGASEAEIEGEHHLSLSLNGTPLGETSFDGKLPHVFSASVSASVLLEGENSLAVTNLGDTGAYSYVFLDRVDLVYPQTPALRLGRFSGVFAETGRAIVSGEARVGLDVTDPDSPVWLQGLRLKAGTVRFKAEASHRYVLASPEGLLLPRVSTPPRSTLKSPENQADYVFIAPEAFLEAAQPLLERRQDQGLTAKVVSFEEIASEFGHGRPSAQAIRDFLAYAYHSWRAPSLRYVLLLGDSSSDPRNFTGFGQGAPLPALWVKTSYLWTASDPTLGAVNGEDLLPDVAVGRLPARTVEEAHALVGKVLAFEDAARDLSGTAVLVADNPDLAGDFEANALDIQASFLGDRPTKTLFLRQLGGNTRPEILASFDEGASLMSYVGHGGPAVWASENVLNSWDTPGLRAQSRQPLMLTFNCLNGYFVAPSYDSLSEAFLKVEGRGTIGAFSPSGLSVDGPAHLFHRALMAEITSGRHERLGDAVLAAQAAYAEEGVMPELLAIYHLLADPGMRIR